MKLIVGARRRNGVTVADELLTRVAWEIDRVVAEPHAHRPRAAMAVVDVLERERVLLPRACAAALDRGTKVLVTGPVRLGVVVDLVIILICHDSCVTQAQDSKTVLHG